MSLLDAMDRFLAVHGHFYQPPRANPFTGQIPREQGAEPFANWNERITSECYRPNAELGNYAKIGFDLGPTLADWLAEGDPATYRAFLEADRQALDRTGAGNALAQVYNHVILPLVPRHDKVTQIRWGVADFRHRYGREPEGMWLSETAVDVETLEVLAEEGIGYTILAPWQSRDPGIDPGEAYRVRLSGGRSIQILFFDAIASTQVSFNRRMTESALEFIELCLPMRDNWLRRRRGDPQLLLMAMDGEFYGHHQRGRERFLRDLLDLAPDHGYRPVTPAEYLRLLPPTREAQIADRTAWSCRHGLARWEFGCACTAGSSDWKGILQTALARLAEQVDAIYLREVRPHVTEPWELRHRYHRVFLGEVDAAGYVRERLTKRPATDLVDRIVALLEAQWFRQLMFTSCGFFFEDVSRIEPLNNLAYAARAISDVQSATGEDLTEEFRRSLKPIRSWRTKEAGDALYDRVVARR
ncbi:MAG TPA: DUF3536 domain-containing protein [Dehalococcoidia bacterium]|nr:DUF3536 domain-containing protein [Dehalococcoidia bacterium]